MGDRDHSITCETCGFQRGGLNDLKCDCTATPYTAPVVDFLDSCQQPWVSVADPPHPALQALRTLLQAFPELRTSYATHAQNVALREAYTLVGPVESPVVRNMGRP